MSIRPQRQARRQLRITTPSGTTEAPFEITAPLPREGRFQGFSTDDVIYLAMPDRFRDGDAANNDPPRSRRPLRPRQGPLLPRRRPQGRHREAAVSQGPRHHGDLAQPVVRQRRPPEREGAVRRPSDHRLPRLRRRRLLRRGRALRLDGRSRARWCEAAHALGIKVIQDQVANHTGPYHPWVADPPTPTWFNGTAAKHLANTWQTWTLQDPHATPQTRRATLDGWFIDILPDLNQEDDEVARYIIQNSLWWVGVLGLDGIRQDTWPYVPRAFWARWMDGAQARVPAADGRGRAVRRRSRHRVVLRGRRASGSTASTRRSTRCSISRCSSRFATRLPRASRCGTSRRCSPATTCIPIPSRLVVFLGNHDMLRFMNETGATTAGLKLAQTFIMTTRGTRRSTTATRSRCRAGAIPTTAGACPARFAGDARTRSPRRGGHRRSRTCSITSVASSTCVTSSTPLRRGALQHLYVAEQQYVVRADGPIPSRCSWRSTTT